MTETIYERIHDTLTWKRIIGFNLVLFLILIVPLSVRLAQQDTENRSGAAGELAAPIVTPPPSYPTNPPKIERVATFFGKPGDTIVIIGANFGDYQWGSRVYIGSAEALKDSVIRWTNTIIEVKIPETARSGRVTILVNGKEAGWEGSLLLYDVARSARIGINKTASGEARLFVINGAGAVRGLFEIAYLSGPITMTPGSNVTMLEQSETSDSLGKKIKVSFNINSPLPSSETNLFTIIYPGIGTLELLRAELYDQNQTMLPIYSDPLNLKTLP